MKISYSVTCKNCKAENTSFALICENCKSYLRERIVNIDLWNMIALIIENPSKGFKKVINAEHKNFVFFLLFLATLKSLLNVMFISLVTLNNENPYHNFFLNYIILTGIIAATLFIASVLIKVISKSLSLITRIKDTFAISVYSLLPYALSVVILFPIELVLFGGDTFSTNPSPLQLKPVLGYILIVFEAGIVCWSIFLAISAFYSQSKNIFYGISVGILLNIILLSEFYIASIYLF